MRGALILLMMFYMSDCFSQTAAYYMERGNNQMWGSNYKAAIVEYDKALALKIGLFNKYNAYYSRGAAKSGLNDFKGAIIDFNKAIELFPDKQECYFERAFAKSELQDFHGAILDYSKVIDLNLKFPSLEPYAMESTYINRGIAKSKLLDFRGAISDFNKALEKDPSSPFPYHQRALVKAKQRDHAGALADYNKALSLVPITRYTSIVYPPFTIEVYLNRGLSKIALDDKNGGCLDFSKAGELGNTEAYKLISKYCQ